MNEFELIKQITHGVPTKLEGLVCGVGDDCAVIAGEGGRDFLVTTDALFEGVHFRLEYTTMQVLGRKALSVNISDIAAMGGRPIYYLVSIGIPKGCTQKDVESIFAGMAQVASAYRMVLIGGDTCMSAGGLLLSITVIGDAPRERCIFRSGAKVSDAVFVTGTLGESSLGLECLKRGMRDLDTRVAIKRHNEPVPRVAAGQWFANSGCVTAMIDISDGLAGDLGHIAEASRVGIVINAGAVPLAEGFVETSSRCQKDPHILALTGGEDYELAFTVSSAKLDLFEKMLGVVAPTFNHKVTKIGEVVEEGGVRVVDVHGVDVPIAHGGFEHRF